MVEISGIIPTYNRAALVGRAIESMLEQRLLLKEIIVVDDGSKDGTKEVVERYGEAVRYVHQENAGGGAARNLGVGLAKSDWVAFLDSDDLWTEDHLMRVSEAIRQTEGRADLYFDDILHRSGEESVSRWTMAGFDVAGDHLIIEDGTPWMMMEHQPMTVPTSVIRRTCFFDVGGFWEDLRTAHDTHFFLRLGIGRPVCAVAGVGAIETEDDLAANRLTVRTGPVRFGRKVNTARLYKDILERYHDLGPNYKSLLRRRICGARWAAGKDLVRDGNVASCLRELWYSLTIHPLMFFQLINPFRWLGNNIRREWERRR